MSFFLACFGVQRVLAVDGHVYARPSVDYRAYHDGLDGSSGLEMGSLRLAVAQRLAKEIRGG